VLKNPKAQGSFFEPLNVTGAATAHVSSPTLRVLFNSMCCTSCSDELRVALQAISWIGAPTSEEPIVATATANAMSNDASPVCSNWLDLPVTDTNKIDFVELINAIHGAGYAPDRIEVAGIAHYRVQSSLKHLTCKACSLALQNGLNHALSYKSRGQFVWLDSSMVDADKKTVTMFMKLDTSVDAVELLAGLNKLGYYPDSARLLLGDHD
jgi:hypothetical protein